MLTLHVFIFFSVCIHRLAESDLTLWRLLTVVGRNYKIVGFGSKNVLQEGNERTGGLGTLGLPCSLTGSSVNRNVLLFVGK